MVAAAAAVVVVVMLCCFVRRTKSLILLCWSACWCFQKARLCQSQMWMWLQRLAVAAAVMWLGQRAWRRRRRDRLWMQQPECQVLQHSTQQRPRAASCRIRQRDLRSTWLVRRVRRLGPVVAMRVCRRRSRPRQACSAAAAVLVSVQTRSRRCRSSWQRAAMPRVCRMKTPWLRATKRRRPPENDERS